MKLIIAYIQPHALSKVEHALLHLPSFPGLSVTEVRGYGQEKASAHLASEELTEFTQKLRLEIACGDEETEPIAAAIAAAAHSGQRGDGKILVLELSEAVLIRTGVRGNAAIHTPTAS